VSYAYDKAGRVTPSRFGLLRVSNYASAVTIAPLEPLRNNYANGRSLSTAYDSRCGPRLERERASLLKI